MHINVHQIWIIPRYEIFQGLSHQLSLNTANVACIYIRAHNLTNECAACKSIVGWRCAGQRLSVGEREKEPASSNTTCARNRIPQQNVNRPILKIRTPSARPPPDRQVLALDIANGGSATAKPSHARAASRSTSTTSNNTCDTGKTLSIHAVLSHRSTPFQRYDLKNACPFPPTGHPPRGNSGGNTPVCEPRQPIGAPQPPDTYPQVRATYVLPVSVISAGCPYNEPYTLSKSGKGQGVKSCRYPE